MKTWHRRLHLIIWLLLTPVIGGTFWYTHQLLQNAAHEERHRQEQAQVSPGAPFQEWEEELDEQKEVPEE